MTAVGKTSTFLFSCYLWSVDDYKPIRPKNNLNRIFDLNPIPRQGHIVASKNLFFRSTESYVRPLRFSRFKQTPIDSKYFLEPEWWATLILNRQTRWVMVTWTLCPLSPKVNGRRYSIFMVELSKFDIAESIIFLNSIRHSDLNYDDIGCLYGHSRGVKRKILALGAQRGEGDRTAKLLICRRPQYPQLTRSTYALCLCCFDSHLSLCVPWNLAKVVEIELSVSIYRPKC